MNSIKLNKGVIYNIIIILLVIYIVYTPGKKKTYIVPGEENEIFIDSPIEQTRFDTIYMDSVNKIEVLKIVEVNNPVNEELLAKYENVMKLNDSLKQLQLYKEAITERQYKEVFEDSVQTITVKSEVIGILKSQVINYKTKPKIIFSDPPKIKTSIYAGGFIYSDLQEVQVGLNLNLVNKEKNRIFTVGYDTGKRVHFGVTFKLI